MIDQEPPIRNVCRLEEENGECALLKHRTEKVIKPKCMTAGTIDNCVIYTSVNPYNIPSNENSPVTE